MPLRLMVTIKTAGDLVMALDQGEFSSIGSYPLYFITSNEDCLHPKCVRELLDPDQTGLGVRELLDTRDPAEATTVDEWKIISHGINWGIPDLYCAHCGARIESACEEQADDS